MWDMTLPKAEALPATYSDRLSVVAALSRYLFCPLVIPSMGMFPGQNVILNAECIGPLQRDKQSKHSLSLVLIKMG